MLTVPYPAGGYAASEMAAGTESGAETSDPNSDAGSDTGAAAGEDQYAELDLSEFDQGVDASTDPNATPATEDLLTEGDLLTLDDFSNGGDLGLESADPAVEPSVDPSVDAGLEPGLDPSGITDSFDTGFIIERWQASMAIAVACLVAFAALNLIRGRQGRVWKAVRDDPIAAAVVGISPSGSKVSAFVVSSLFAALAGAVFAQILSFVGPGAFSLGLSLSLLVGIVLGGRSSLLGAILGALIIVWLPELVDGLAGDRGWPDQITNNAPNLLYGLLVVAVVLAAPGGITGTVRSWIDKSRGKSRSPLS